MPARLRARSTRLTVATPPWAELTNVIDYWGNIKVRGNFGKLFLALTLIIPRELPRVEGLIS